MSRTTLRKRNVLAVGALAALAAGAAVAEGPAQDAPQAVRDAWIDGRLETTFALNPHLESYHIDSEVANGIVSLSGTVENDIERDLAVAIARAVDGVSEVRFEALGVDSSLQPQTTAADQARSFPQWIRDATTTARVKSNLVSNGNTKNLGIEVDTRDDVVILAGAVPSRKEKMLAEMIARNTDGITSVQNKIEIPDDERS